MRPTDPPPPIGEHGTSPLVEELCLALRDIGVFDGASPDNERGSALVQRVQDIHAELVRRQIDVAPRLERLSQETGWMMHQLLVDCLKFPAAPAWLRERDGVRRAFRCPGCRLRERPESDKRFFLCDECLRTVRAALECHRSNENILLYRTYTPEARCEHAADDTVVAVFPWYGSDRGFDSGFCKRCIDDELARRRRAG